MRIEMYRTLLILFLLFLTITVSSQEIRMSEMASLEQIYGESQQSQNVLSMNDLGISFGYVLYETEITIDSEIANLVVENVRDYAAVFIDGSFKGGMTDEKKTLSFQATTGKHKLQMYVENIGRITYGPEILDNSKGLFGIITLNGTEIEDWKMTPLLVKDCSVNDLQFAGIGKTEIPCFYKGKFQLDTIKDTNLNISGWGMGEVWINGQYMGTYWDENSQQSIQIPASALAKGENCVVVFEMKKNGKLSMSLADRIIFK